MRLNASVLIVCTPLLSLQWTANATNDMYADAVLSVLMQIEGDTTGNALSGELIVVDVSASVTSWQHGNHCSTTSHCIG